MTGWSIVLAIVSAALAPTGLTMTVLGYVEIQRERAVQTTWNDAARMRGLIADFVVAPSFGGRTSRSASPRPAS